MERCKDNLFYPLPDYGNQHFLTSIVSPSPFQHYKINSYVLKTIRDELTKDESSVPKNMEGLTREVEKLKTSKDNLEKEVKSVRRGLDNWRIQTENNSKQIENNVDKKINKNLDALFKARKELNYNAESIKLSIKQMVKDELIAEFFKLDSPSRRCVMEEVKKAEESIFHNLDGYVGMVFEEDDT